MELVKGVNLHFIKSNKFKTNRIKVRFSAPLSSETVAGRVLAASMLSTANQLYPSAQTFREKLASLYGASYTTSVSRRGLVHYVDIDLSFVRDTFLSKKNVITNEMVDFLRVSLLAPLAEAGAFEQVTYDIEKKNVIADLEAEIENHFYHAHQELNRLFFQKEELKISRFGSVNLVKKETAESSYAIFQQMLQQDQIDIFFVGEFNELGMKEKFSKFGFQSRTRELQLHYQQSFSNVTREQLERRDSNQSILELGYDFQSVYGDENHLPLIVLNGLLGGFAHSKLFVTIREKESLAYTISSNFDIFTGMLRIYAGIDGQNRMKVLALISKQIQGLKRGNFLEQELEQTKKMVKNAALLAQDRQSTLLERAYLSSVLGKKFLSLNEWLAALDSVTKEDIIRVAKELHLQAIYFMEGK
ncbi:Zinc protease [Streptococcus sp. DD10]|uniref:EF-P 5-aminopentanol modification-associated protein YfmF n=1 Tax=Streptococcus sp. DD10 TaxID=1777878 RepID=UPI00079AFE3B|nr:Zinc protease [Streptococcus sp. DD10]